MDISSPEGKGLKNFNMCHSRRAGFSNSELSGKNVEKSSKHALRCASVSSKKFARHVLSKDTVPSIRSDTLIRLPSVQYQRIADMRGLSPCILLLSKCIPYTTTG